MSWEWEIAIGNDLEEQSFEIQWTECVFPEFVCWNPNAQCDVIKRQGLWDISRSGG